MRLRKWALIAAGAIATVVVAGVLFVVLAGWGFLREPVARLIGEPIARKVAIEGALDLDLGWTTHVRMSDVTVANAEWSKSPEMIHIGELEADIKPWELVTGRLSLPRLIVRQPKIVLERNAEGKANWDFAPTDATGAAAKAIVPEKRSEFPAIGQLDISDGTLAYRDARSGDNIEAKLNRAQGESAEHGQRIAIEAKGTYQKQPFALLAEAGSLLTLRDSSKPYPLRVDVTAGRTRAHIEGTVTEPLAARGLDLKLDLRGATMSDLYPLLGIALPPTAPYTLRGELRREGGQWAFHNFAGTVGNSDLGGNVDIDAGQKRPVMKAALVSKLLDLDDLAGFIGAKPNAGEASKKAPDDKGGVLPDEPVDLERLNAMDAEATLKAERIKAPDLPIDKLDARLSLRHGVLQLHPADFRAADGHVLFNLTLDSTEKQANTKVDIQLQRLSLAKLMKDSKFAEESGGLVGGSAKLAGTGLSTHAILSTATGEAFLVMSGGQISALLVELAGLDVFKALGLLAEGDKPIPIRCVVANLKAKEGRFDTETLVFDTSRAKIVGNGYVDMHQEQVDLLLVDEPKDFSPLTFRQPLRMTGTFKDLSVFPDPLKTDQRGPLAKVINGVLTAILGLIPPIDAGVGEDTNCASLIQAARSRGAAPPPNGGGKAPADVENPAAKTPPAGTKSR
jgi:uncharacterized protein involved in outer membrane biogenesis